MACEVDRISVELLGRVLVDQISPELVRQPFSNDNVLVVLNALAYCVAAVLAGRGNAFSTREFYETALENNLEELMRMEREH